MINSSDYRCSDISLAALGEELALRLMRLTWLNATSIGADREAHRKDLEPSQQLEIYCWQFMVTRCDSLVIPTDWARYFDPKKYNLITFKIDSFCFTPLFNHITRSVHSLLPTQTRPNVQNCQSAAQRVPDSSGAILNVQI
jgi:hypothetical protein